MQVLPVEQWQAREHAHRERVGPWLEPRLRRRSTGAKDPVDDFLFDYYSLRPARLLVWHPGLDVVLEGATQRGPHYRRVPGGIAVDPDALLPRLPRLRRSLRVLQATAARAPSWRCFGMHEWAMVHGLAPHQVRHPQLRLRLEPEDITAVVAEVGLTCTHFDAYRFFTATALPAQRPLSRAAQESDEQPACLHAGMDLYRYTYEALPFVPSELVADCFALARRARLVDMRASPYDLADPDAPAIPVETAAGRAEYTRLQRSLAADSAVLRGRVIDVLSHTVAIAASVAD